MTIRSAAVVLAAILLACSPGLHGQSTAERMQDAQDLYQEGRFEQAAGVYEGLLAEGYRDARLYYNLGNAYVRLDSLGAAVLAYERALKLDPGDEDARYNLDWVRSRLPGRIEPLPPFFLRQWWRALRDAASPTFWAILTVILLWLGAASVVLWLRGPSRRLRQWGFLLAFVLLISSLLPFFLGADRQAYLRHSGRAVVMVEEQTLRAAPENESQAIMPVYEGTVVRLLDLIGDWHKVRLQNGEQGWLPVRSVEEI